MIGIGSRRPAWLGGATTLLALLTCYGTGAVIALLSLLGVTVALHEGAWAGAISLFAVLAALIVGFGYRRHGHKGPAILALAGAAGVVWTMFGAYSTVLEIAGFVALTAGALWDWRVGRSRPHPEESGA